MILSGARQVGKTHAVRNFGKSEFNRFVEINFELHPEAKNIFIKDLSPQRIIRDLTLFTGQKIIPGETLLFLDEIQLAYANSKIKNELYYWQQENSSEVDYLMQKNNVIIPIEVKSSHGTSLKSIRNFLNIKKKSPYGIRFSTHNFSVIENIHSYPLYAVAAAINYQQPL